MGRAARILVVCFLVALGAALSAAHGAASASGAEARQTHAALVVHEGHAPARHPCNGGRAPSSTGACTAPGPMIGLAAHDGDRIIPPRTPSQRRVLSWSAVDAQWRGLPPDRPPRG